jgi:hypothetical protein
MQNKEVYKLFIDELGTADPKDLTSDLYILSGCSVSKTECQTIKNWSEHIKFKYWGRTNIVFHSREIGRKENDFLIFKDTKVFDSFSKDLFDFLKNMNFKMFFIVVDKKRAREAGWDKIKVYKDTTVYLIKNFLLTLFASGSRGEIIIESASAEKDIYLLHAFNYFMSSGIQELDIDYKETRELLTSVSFVTKHNHDIEEQIADLFAYAAKLKYLGNQNHKNDYDKKMVSMLNLKIFQVPINAGKTKDKFFKHIHPFLVLP